jgi:hypothetical protein
MENLVKEEIILEEEIIDFYIEDGVYFAISTSGRIFHIRKIVCIQPEILDEKEFFAYLWMEAIEGFFLLRQKIKEGKAEKWILEKEVVPFEYFNFFENYQKIFKEMLRKR